MTSMMGFYIFMHLKSDALQNLSDELELLLQQLRDE